MKIIDMQGIGPAYAKKLNAAGVVTAAALLKKGASAKGRLEIAKAAGVGKHLVLDWVNMADLFRITGIGSQYAELLRKAGVNTVIELSNRVPKHLYAEMQKINQTKNLVNQMPGVGKVEDWIKQAKKLPKVVTY